nr:copia protein [Tanacetum cinerariifolium]
MHTRNSYFPNNPSVTIPWRQNKRLTPNVVEPELRTIVEMADNRTIEELIQAPTEGYGEAIVISKIIVDHFKIKMNLLQLVQANPYHDFERENPHTHINNFKRIISTLKFRDVPNDVIKLMMFPYSLEGNARVWVEENLHIEFLENKAFEKGSGPNWLFDIDFLTKSMNYVLVVDAGTNSTNFLGTKVDARQDVKKDVSSLRYIVLPNWVHEEHLESPLSQPQYACNTDAPESMETLIPTVSSPVPTVCFTDSQETSSETRLILKWVTNQAETPSLDNILTLSNQFEDILGVTTNSKESNGVEADVSNMETTITASPTHTLRIHRDHPKSQIIGHVDTLIQTRNKSKEKQSQTSRSRHTQEEGIDYNEVFAPVVRIEAIRLFLAYASFMGFTVYQMDVKSAFLYGTIDEEVYVIQPPGFQDPEYPARVYKVEKAIEHNIDFHPMVDFIAASPLRQYTRRARIAQSSTLPPIADEPASPVRDVSQGEASLTDSGFIANQDRATIAKSSTLPHDSTPMVTSPAAEEGRVIGDRSRDDASIKGRRIDKEEVATKRVSSDTEEVRLDEREVAAERASEDTEEMATVLTTMDAAIVLASAVVDVPTSSGSIPTASTPAKGSVSTGSEEVPTASPVFATATVVTPYKRRKGKEVMVESETHTKQKVQEQIDTQVARELKEQLEREDQRRAKQIARDAEIARIHAEEELHSMIDGLDSNNETVAKYLEEYHHFSLELPMERRIELISDLVKYQDNYTKVKDFKGMTFEEVEAKFNSVYKQMEYFILMGSKEEAERIKRKGINLEQESVKKQKSSEEITEEAKSPEEVTEEKINEMMQLVPIEEVYVEALQFKHPIIDWELWSLVKETLSKRPATSEKEMELWVELSRLYEPNVEDQLWTHTQNFIHAPAEWKLYDKCGVHQVTSKEKDIFMLVEKDYPLRKGLAFVMICYKLQVENYSQMVDDLVWKIYNIADSPRQQGD